MDKRLIWLFGSALLTFVGTAAGAEDRTKNAKQETLADWVVSEGYAWEKVDREILFCRVEIATGSHIRINRCIDQNQLETRWQASKSALRPLPPSE